MSSVTRESEATVLARRPAVRALLYLGEGLVLGSLFFFLLDLFFFVTYLVTQSELTAGIVAIAGLMALLGARDGWIAILAARRSTPERLGAFEQEWKTRRKWEWTLSMGIVVTGGLILLTFHSVGWPPWALSSYWSPFLLLWAVLSIGVIIRFGTIWWLKRRSVAKSS